MFQSKVPSLQVFQFPCDQLIGNFTNFIQFSDNVSLNIDGVLYVRVNDPYRASYGVDDPEFAIVQLGQTTMRSELGKISLDKVFREREGLNVSIVESLNKASEAWGITCLRYEIREWSLPLFIN